MIPIFYYNTNETYILSLPVELYADKTNIIMFYSFPRKQRRAASNQPKRTSKPG